MYELAAGQTARVECPIEANPASSVHFSWFKQSYDGATIASRASVSAWRARDESLDEQIDESRQTIEFKVRDASSFALLKCKAKNEIGLQQRACLIRVARAKPPSLRHTCRLAHTRDTSLQLQCEPSEHLKSEEFEISGGGGATSEQLAGDTQDRQQQSLSSWSERQATGALQQSSSGARQRLVYPPEWLLVELHKQQQQQHTNGNSLEAYVAVVGAERQLARVKNLLEQNRLLSANPRGVFYVCAKLNASSSVSSDDAGLRMPSEPFVFNVPNLEPDTAYKLVIYGQNLANVTRDSVVVEARTTRLVARAEPVVDVTTTSSSGLAGLARSQRVGVDSAQQHQQSDDSDNDDKQPQKTLVMRMSDNESHQQQQQQRVTTQGDNYALAEHMHLLAKYSDSALAYARHKPLLAVPVAVSVVVCTALLVVWTGSLLARAMCGQRGAKRRSASHKCQPRRVNDDDNNNDDGDDDDDEDSLRKEVDKIAFIEKQHHQTPATTTTTTNSAEGCGEQRYYMPGEQGSNGSSSGGSNSSSAGGRSGMTTTTSGCSAGGHSPAWQATGFALDTAAMQHLYSTDSEYGPPLPPTQQGLVFAAPPLQRCGSLDRRATRLEAEQPIYVTDSGSALLHVHLSQLDSSPTMLLDPRTLELGYTSTVSYADEQQQQHELALLNSARPAAARAHRHTRVAFALNDNACESQHAPNSCATASAGILLNKSSSRYAMAAAAAAAAASAANGQDSGMESPATTHDSNASAYQCHSRRHAPHAIMLFKDEDVSMATPSLDAIDRLVGNYEMATSFATTTTTSNNLHNDDTR